MNTPKVAAALNTISLAFGELAEALVENGAPPATAPVPAPSSGIQEAMPEFPPNDYEDIRVAPAVIESAALSRCPAHDRPWTVKAAGVSKAGKAYNSFFKCDGKDGDAFCNRKPVKAWADAHMAQLA